MITPAAQPSAVAFALPEQHEEVQAQGRGDRDAHDLLHVHEPRVGPPRHVINAHD
jgi:hypothetical protein